MTDYVVTIVSNTENSDFGHVVVRANVSLGRIKASEASVKATDPDAKVGSPAVNINLLQEALSELAPILSGRSAPWNATRRRLRNALAARVIKAAQGRPVEALDHK